MLDFSPHNPCRDIHWRWARAGYILETARPLSRRQDDTWVRRAYAFREAQAKCVDNDDFYALAAHFPGLYWAHRLWSQRDDPQNRLHTHALEARLLADQPRDEIEERLNLQATVVDAYAQVFFDVKPHLGAPDYLTFKVLGEAVYRGLRERQYDLLWKLYALWGGPHVVDVMLSTFVNPSRPPNADAVGAFIQDAVKGRLALKAMTASQAIEINGHTAGYILELYLKQVEIEKRGDGAGGAHATILQNIGMLMHSLPFSVGDKSSEAVGRTPLAITMDRYDDGACELTGDEVLSLAVGDSMADLERLETLAFPTPPSPEVFV